MITRNSNNWGIENANYPGRWKYVDGEINNIHTCSNFTWKNKNNLKEKIFTAFYTFNKCILSETLLCFHNEFWSYWSEKRIPNRIKLVTIYENSLIISILFLYIYIFFIPFNLYISRKIKERYFYNSIFFLFSFQKTSFVAEKNIVKLSFKGHIFVMMC